jgi:hypothetical protein
MGVDLKKLDASRIETALYGLVRPLFAEPDVYVMSGTRDMTVNLPRQIYCNAPIDVKNLSAYGRTITRLEIYVEKLGGLKDAATLTRIRDVMTDELATGFTLDGYRFEHIEEITGDDRAGYNYIFINLATVIL